MRSIFLFLFLFPLFIYSQEMLTRTQALMGTYVSITLPKEHNQEISDAFVKIKKIESSLSSYDPSAQLYKLNETHHVAYDKYLSQALRISKKLYHETDGYFDITIGSISKQLYRFGEADSTIPSPQSLKNATLNIEGVHVGKRFIETNSDITIDLGGMGKGFAVDHVALDLQELNITKGIIALSGDMRCLDLCQVGIQSPYKETPFALLYTKVPHLSISTSGTYRRYVKNPEHHHLINPKHATQGRSFISVSLFTKADNTKIDAYATAVSVMPEEKALTFLKNKKEIGYILMTQNGKIYHGHLDKLVSLEWVDRSENAISNNKKTNNDTKADIEKSLTHPVEKTPDEISK